MPTHHPGDLGTQHVISSSDEHKVIGKRHFGSIPLILKGTSKSLSGLVQMKAFGGSSSPTHLSCSEMEPWLVDTVMIHSSWSLVFTFSHPLNTPMINAKPATLPSCCASTRSLIAIIVYTVEVALLATPPAISSGESAALRPPLSIILDDVPQTHAAERPRGRAVPCLFSIESRWAALGEEEVRSPGRLCAGLFAHVGWKSPP